MKLRDILITNTLTNKKELLKPVEPGHIKMYACGVTVYDDCHIGHAMQAIFFDVIRNYLEFCGYNVTYVRNYTDVDDKIINRARELNIPPLELSKKIIQSSNEDMANLRIRKATYEPLVSETIPEIIAMIENLINKGHAYPTKEGDVYFRVKSKKDYGKLSNRKPDDMRSGTRSLASSEKEDELDFALWKKDETPGASWESPWGPGRPGWHIECSAMARKYLGEHLDIHGGGRDLIFPHHENEIAQSECSNGCNYVNFWMHSGLLTINKQKMSKSLGNHITIRSFLERWPAEVLRLAYLQQHYTSNTDFSESVFQACAKKLLYYYETLEALDEASKKKNQQNKLLSDHSKEDLVETFHNNMTDDFNTVCAIRDLHAAIQKGNAVLKTKKSVEKANTCNMYQETLRELFGVLGLLKEKPKDFIEELKNKVLPFLGITQQEIEELIEKRNNARKNKDFGLGDELRKELIDRGIEIMDTPTGTKWSIRFSGE